MLNVIKSTLKNKYVKWTLLTLGACAAGAGVYYACKKQEFLTDEEVQSLMDNASECIKVGEDAWDATKASVEI